MIVQTCGILQHNVREPDIRLVEVWCNSLPHSGCHIHIPLPLCVQNVHRREPQYDCILPTLFLSTLVGLRAEGVLEAPKQINLKI